MATTIILIVILFFFLGICLKGVTNHDDFYDDDF